MVRQKPDFVGPDGGNDTFLGFTLASQNIPDNSTIAGCQNNAKFSELLRHFGGHTACCQYCSAVAAGKFNTYSDGDLPSLEK